MLSVLNPRQRAWGMTLAGGILEVVWATSLKLTSERWEAINTAEAGAGREATTMAIYLLITIAAIIASFDLLTRACRILPVGTVYAVFAGIGAAGVTLVGIAALGETFSILKITLLMLLIACIVGLKWTEDSAEDAVR